MIRLIAGAVAVISPLLARWPIFTRNPTAAQATPLVNETVPKLAGEVQAMAQRIAQLEALADGTQPEPAS